MSGVEIESGRRSSFPVLSLVLAVISAVLLIWVGPRGVYFSSSVGLALAVAAIFSGRGLPSFARRTGLAKALLPIHLLFLFAAFALQAVFLIPLSQTAARLPKFRHVYVDPDGLFRLRGPVGWKYTRAIMGTETGVRIQPVGREAYMGVSELSVLVRRLDAAPASPEAFLDRMATSMAARPRKNAKGPYQFNVSSATVLDGGQGVWTVLDIKRFWVPLHQVSLLGIKNERYLCSVSATGLKSHSNLSDLVCLGVFETIQIGDANLKQSLKKQ